MAKIDIFEDQWCDIVFEGKNKSFGAYVLRKDTPNRHIKALFIAAIAFILAIISPILIKNLAASQEKEGDTSVREITYVEPIKKKEKEVEVIDIPPPPPEKVLSTIAFPPPVIKKDEEVPEEEIKTQAEIMHSEVAVGARDQIGNTEEPDEVPVANNIAPQVQVKEKVFDVVEVDPQFPGGMESLYDFLRKNINYPTVAKEMGIQGKVIVQFVVGNNGKIRDVKVVKGVDKMLDEEALRVVRSMPAWNPGKQGNQTVSVRYTMPIIFLFQE